MDLFHDLYQRHAGDVFRFALYLCGERALAEDITSETFVRAWTAPGAIRAATVKGYLLTIARNLYLHELRRRRPVAAVEPQWLETRPDPAASPEQQASQRETARAAMQVLHTLPETDRTALLLRAVEGLEYREIAGVLQLPLSAVKIKIHRARLALAGIRRHL